MPYEVSQEVGAIRGFVEEQLKKNVSPEDVAAALSEEYPAEKDVVLRALAETIEQVNAGYPVPTDKRVIFEDWGELSLSTQTSVRFRTEPWRQLLGQVLSEKMGYTAVVQHDPYRIFVQTMGAVNADHIVVSVHPNAEIVGSICQRQFDPCNFENRSVQETNDSRRTAFRSLTEMG